MEHDFSLFCRFYDVICRHRIDSGRSMASCLASLGFDLNLSLRPQQLGWLLKKRVHAQKL